MLRQVRTCAEEIDQLLATELLGRIAAPGAPASDPPGLHVCPACARPFVVAGEAREIVGADRLRIDLSCANCDWSDTTVRHDHELAALEMQMDRSFADLLWALEVVWIGNEETAIARFAAALDAGQILPEDF